MHPHRRRPAVAGLIDEAIDRNSVPFPQAPAAGRWSIVRHRSVGGAAPTNLQLHLTRPRAPWAKADRSSNA